MGNIKVNQTNLIINFDLGSDITGCTVVIEGRDPKGYDITALPVNVTDALTGKVQYTSTILPDFTIVGVYTLWAYVVFPDGKKTWGDSCSLKINSKGI